jgi:hypothetical protein
MMKVYRKILSIVTVTWIILGISGCAAIVSVSEFDDGKTVGWGNTKALMAIEEAELYHYTIHTNEKIHDNAIVVSGKIVYGITNNLDISYSTWSNSIPIVTAIVSLKYNFFSKDSTFAAAKLSAGNSSYSGTGMTTSTEKDEKTANYNGFAISIPVSHKSQGVSYYLSPRILFSTYTQHYTHQYFRNNAWWEKENIYQDTHEIRFALSSGTSITIGSVALNPEITLIQTDGKFIPHWGISLSK